MLGGGGRGRGRGRGRGERNRVGGGEGMCRGGGGGRVGKWQHVVKGHMGWIGTDGGGAWGKRDGAGTSEEVGREGVVCC